jgi:hypothetical protein
MEKGLGPLEQTNVKPEPVEVFNIVQEHVEEQPNMSLIHKLQEVQGARLSLRVSKGTRGSPLITLSIRVANLITPHMSKQVCPHSLPLDQEGFLNLYFLSPFSFVRIIQVHRMGQAGVLQGEQRLLDHLVCWHLLCQVWQHDLSC